MSEKLQGGLGEMIRSSERLMEGADKEDIVDGGDENGERFLIERGVIVTTEDEVRFIKLPAPPISGRFMEEGEFGGPWDLLRGEAVLRYRRC